MTNPEEPKLIAAGGWCAPTESLHGYSLAEMAEGYVPPSDVAMVRTGRGGARFGEVKFPEGSKRLPLPERDPRGHWEYGADIADYEDGDTEPEMVSGAGGWDRGYEPYLTREDAERDWADHPIYKRWVPAAGAWDKLS